MIIKLNPNPNIIGEIVIPNNMFDFIMKSVIADNQLEEQ